MDNGLEYQKEVYDIFKYVVNNRLDIEELNNCIIDNEDKKFITEVYNRLLNKKLINNTFESNNIKSIGFELTNRCNLKCIHCCVDADITHRYELSTRLTHIPKIYFVSFQTVLLLTTPDGLIGTSSKN